MRVLVVWAVMTGCLVMVGCRSSVRRVTAVMVVRGGDRPRRAVLVVLVVLAVMVVRSVTAVMVVPAGWVDLRVGMAGLVVPVVLVGPRRVTAAMVGPVVRGRRRPR